MRRQERVHSSHAVHADTRGCVWLYAGMGKRVVMTSANRIKLNTPSSTETEIVGLGEKLPKCIWFWQFREAQNGYVDKDVLYQDNKSNVILENNGIQSARRGSKHIHVHFYLIINWIKKKEFKIMYCPTG